MDKFLKRKVGVLRDGQKQTPPAADTRKSKEPPKKKKSKTVKIQGKTIEQHRRALGDQVKSKISVDKWAISARTSVQTTLPLQVFEELVVPNAKTVTPNDFTKSTPVVVAHLKTSQCIGEVFGHSKIKGGTRMGSWAADKADVIYFPPTETLRVWWTMY